MAITLTIGIPTFNGEKYISQAIDSIVSQLASSDSKGEIEILFSDNGSTDATEEIIADWTRLHPTLNFSYYRNEQNLGFDQNVDLLFKRARGKYVWMFADDDVQCPGSIECVLRCIAQNRDVDIFLGNLEFYDEQMEIKLHELTLNGGQDCRCRDADEFVNASGGRYGNVSSLIIRTQKWNNTPLLEDAGKNYIHVNKLFQALPASRSYVIARPIFKARHGSVNFERSGDDMITVPLELLKIFFAIKELRYKKSTLRSLVRQQRKYIFGRLKTASRKGFQRRGTILRELFRYNYDYPPFWYKIVHFLR